MGLLSDLATQRECPRGHGVMEKQPGLWVLQQVERDGLLQSGGLRLTGQLLTVYTHVCRTCGHVELVNEVNA